MKPFVSLPNTKKTYFPFDDEIIKEEIIEEDSLIKNIEENSTSGSSQNNIIHIPFKKHVKNYYSEFNINNNVQNNNNFNDFPFIKPKSNDEINKNKIEKNNNNSKKNLPGIKRPFSSRNSKNCNKNNVNYNTKKVEKELNCLINNIPQNLLDDPEINKKFSLIMKNIDELKQCVNNKKNYFNNNNFKIQQKNVIYNKKSFNKINQPSKKK